VRDLRSLLVLMVLSRSATYTAWKDREADRTKGGSLMATVAAPRAVVAAAIALAVALTACNRTSGGGNSSPRPAGARTPPPASVSTPGTGSSTESPIPPESPAPVENNPPGDIPDNQVFVTYRSSNGGFAIKVPEGWSRRTHTKSVAFTDKLNTISVSWGSAASAPTVASAERDEVPQLQTSERAFQLEKVSSTSLPAGSSVLMQFRENSTPNAVTGKQYRLDVLRYELFRTGTEAVITLSSPVGADNVDPWRIVSQSFQWA